MNLPAAAPAAHLLQVAVSTPAHSALGDLLSYACDRPLPPGTLVRVPLGRREVLGVVWDAPAEPPPLPADMAPRAVAGVLEGMAPLDAAWRRLVAFAARYYQRALGELALAALPPQLRELTPERVEAWAAKEAKARPTQARLALRILRAFLNWCAADARYSPAMDGRNATSSKKVREALGKPKAKADALLREQLAPWFEAVRNLPPTAAAYLQGLLLTGTRPTELRELQWEDLNWQWKGLTVRDKVEGERVIPLTPYLAHLLAGLPRRGPYVFAGIKEGQPMSRPHRYLVQACAVAGIEGLTLHGLRRSFGTLSEWLEIPAGVVAQIQGHKPSATAEKHYRVRPLDLLRLHHERIEAWILEQAGVQFSSASEPGKLRVVAGQ